MDLSAASSATTDWYTATLARLGQGPTAPQGVSAAASPAPPSTPDSTNASAEYTPSAAVQQALTSATTGLLADYSTLIAPAKTAASSSGFTAALGMSADLALTAYADTLSGIPNSTATAAASAASSSANPTSTSTTQSAIQAAQAAMYTSTVNLLG